jgi:hypothetical protein
MKLSSSLSHLSLALAVALGLFSASTVKADPILFDPDGPGGASGPLLTTGLGFGPGNVLAVNAIPGGNLVVGSTFNVYFQTHLTSLVGQNTVPGLNSTYQVTEVGVFTETVTSISTGPNGTTATFALVPSATNRINIYQNNAVVFNDAAGTGFTAGTLIASLNPTSFNGSNFTNSGNTGPFNSTGTPGNNSGTGTAAVGTGSTGINNSVLTSNSAYFLTQPLLSSVFLTSLSTQFDAVPPSRLFTNPLTNTTITPVIGAVNGNSGPDIQSQSAGFTQSFAVPEPASVAMTALGLVGAGLGSFAARRRQAKASA